MCRFGKYVDIFSKNPHGLLLRVAWIMTWNVTVHVNLMSVVAENLRRGNRTSLTKTHFYLAGSRIYPSLQIQTDCRVSAAVLQPCPKLLGLMAFPSKTSVTTFIIVTKAKLKGRRGKSTTKGPSWARKYPRGVSQTSTPPRLLEPTETIERLTLPVTTAVQ